MDITPTFSIRQASAIIHAINVCLHLADKSPNSAAAYGIDLTKVKTLNSALDQLDASVPQPSPTQTTEPCNTLQPIS